VLVASQTGAVESLEHRIDAFVRDEMRHQQIPGVAIGVIRKSVG